MRGQRAVDRLLLPTRGGDALAGIVSDQIERMVLAGSADLLLQPAEMFAQLLRVPLTARQPGHENPVWCSQSSLIIASLLLRKGWDES